MRKSSKRVPLWEMSAPPKRPGLDHTSWGRTTWLKISKEFQGLFAATSTLLRKNERPQTTMHSLECLTNHWFWNPNESGGGEFLPNCLIHPRQTDRYPEHFLFFSWRCSRYCTRSNHSQHMSTCSTAFAQLIGAKRPSASWKLGTYRNKNRRWNGYEWFVSWGTLIDDRFKIVFFA